MKKFLIRKKISILLGLVVLVAVFFRFYNLSLVPPSASLDEVSIGWNAYSILQTGHDEYGYRLPMLLRAYDDYRPALYVYLVIPFIKLFGLSVLAVRLPSVIMSVTTVAMSFFLIRSMLFMYKKRESIALITASIFAISPWHIYISRLGHEVNLGLTLVILASLLFFIFVEKKKPLYLIFSLAVFGLGFYSYQSEKIFIPLLVLLLLFAFWRHVLTSKKQLTVGLVLAAAIALPMVIASFSPTGMIRLKATSAFIDNPAYVKSANDILLDKKKHDYIGQVLSNRRTITLEIFAANYFSHFDPKWIFFSSGKEAFKAPGTGLLYLWELPFVILGSFFFFLHKKIPPVLKMVVGGWFVVNFIAPGITTQAPHAMRAFTVFPLPPLFDAFGIVVAISAFYRYVGKIITWTFLFLLAFLVMQSVVTFSYDYFQLFPMESSKPFQYALMKAIPFFEEKKNQYQQIIVSNRRNLHQSYMFYLFYTKYDPVRYAKSGGTTSGGFDKTHRIDNVTFRKLDWPNEAMQNTLYAGNPDSFPKGIDSLAVFNYLDGTPGVMVVAR